MESFSPGKFIQIDAVPLELQDCEAQIDETPQLWVTTLIHSASRIISLIKVTDYPIAMILTRVNVVINFECAEKTFQTWLFLVYNPSTEQTLYAELIKDEPEDDYFIGLLEQLPAYFSDVSPSDGGLDYFKQLVHEVDEVVAVSLYSYPSDQQWQRTFYL